MATGIKSSTLSPCRASNSSRAWKPALSSLIRNLANWLPSWSTRAMSWCPSAQSMPQKIALNLSTSGLVMHVHFPGGARGALIEVLGARHLMSRSCLQRRAGTSVCWRALGSRTVERSAPAGGLAT